MSEGEREVSTPTIHGDIEYTVVACASCGDTVRKEDAYRFIIYDTGGEKRDREWHNHHEWEVYDGHYVTGYACPYCYDSGPIEYPQVKNTARRLNSIYTSIFIDESIGMWRLGTMVFVVISLLMWTAIITTALAHLI